MNNLEDVSEKVLLCLRRNNYDIISRLVFFSASEKKLQPGYIQIIDAESDEPYTGESVVQNSYDGFLEKSALLNCFLNKNPDAGWATYTIPKSQIKKIELFSWAGNYLSVSSSYFLFSFSAR